MIQHETTISNASFTEGAQTIDGLVEVKNFISSFLIALKNYGLYPAHHNINQKSLTTVKKNIDEFLAGHKFLRIKVEEHDLIFQGEVVHRDKSQEQELAFLLFRDGFLWFEFQNGLDIEELETFLGLLIKHRIIQEGAEDDLATAMWEADLPHLRYKIADGIWAGEPIVDFAGLKAGHSPRQQTREIYESFIETKNINVSGLEGSFFELGYMDMNKIMSMVREEEARNSTQDCLDVLAIILREQHTQEDCLTVTDFLVGEIQYALSQCEFNYILSFLESLRALSVTSSPDKPWLGNLLADFQRRISGPEVLKVLEQSWVHVNSMPDKSLEDLHRFLLMLAPEALDTLIPMVSRIRYPRIEKIFMHIIAVRACEGLVSIRKVTESVKEELLPDFIRILGYIDRHEATKLLFDLTKHSSSNQVREYAINTLMERDPENLQALFPLIEDRQPTIQHLICKHLGKQRSEMAERLLLAYLKKNRSTKNNRDHILDCYRAFGRCAGPLAIPFLQDILLKRDWNAFIGLVDDPHRQGAAMSLMMMPKLWKADMVVQKAARSIYPGIRCACRQGEKEILKTGRRV